uniref:Ras-like protein family member 12 n=1 Tax=Lygus hesperus TaxID=30085 RepID=A0A0A9Z9U7_LYGHE
MQNQRQPLQPEEGVQPEAPVYRVQMVGNGPMRDYRTIQRAPGLARQMRHGNEPLYCVPMTKCMFIMSIIFTGAIILILFILLVSEFTNRIEIEFTPRTTEIPKYY